MSISTDKATAIRDAVAHFDLTGKACDVIRRGDRYGINTLPSGGPVSGWRTIDMIRAGNVDNYRNKA